MVSPPTSPSQNPQGASQISGGVIHGQALGNVFNLGDASDLQMDLDLMLAVLGKVYIYDSGSDVVNLDPTKVKPQWVLKADVSQMIMPILTKLGWKYSPIHSESKKTLLFSSQSICQNQIFEFILMRTMNGS